MKQYATFLYLPAHESLLSPMDPCCILYMSTSYLIVIPAIRLAVLVSKYNYNCPILLAVIVNNLLYLILKLQFIIAMYIQKDSMYRNQYYEHFNENFDHSLCGWEKRIVLTWPVKNLLGNFKNYFIKITEIAQKYYLCVDNDLSLPSSSPLHSAQCFLKSQLIFFYVQCVLQYQ